MGQNQSSSEEDSAEEEEEEDEKEEEEEKEKLPQSFKNIFKKLPPLVASTCWTCNIEIPNQCRECSSSKKSRSTDDEMKHKALYSTILAYRSVCNKVCHLKQTCNVLLNIKNISELQELFWGPDDGPAPTSQERGTKIKKILTSFWSPTLQEFTFSIGGIPRVEVCERAFLRALGLLSETHGHIPLQWRKIKEKISGNLHSELLEDGKIRMGRDRNASKSEIMKAFIQHYKENQCDMIDELNEKGKN